MNSVFNQIKPSMNMIRYRIGKGANSFPPVRAFSLMNEECMLVLHLEVMAVMYFAGYSIHSVSPRKQAHLRLGQTAPLLLIHSLLPFLLPQPTLHLHRYQLTMASSRQTTFCPHKRKWSSVTAPSSWKNTARPSSSSTNTTSAHLPQSITTLPAHLVEH